MILYCDLDDVLVDWQTPFFSKYPELKISPSIFTKIVELGEPFFSNLPWTKDGKNLWSHINRYRPKILSAAAILHFEVEPEIVKGKLNWISNNLGKEYVDTAIICHRNEKNLYSGYNKILIDDNNQNIKEWEEKGGIGILHTNYMSTLEKLNEAFKIIK